MQKKAEDFNEWLIIIGLGLLVIPFNIILSMIKTYIELSISINYKENNFLLTALNIFWIDILFLVIWLFIIVLFFKKKKLFPKLFAIALVLLLFISIFNDISKEPISYFLLIEKVIISSVLVSYMLFSKYLKLVFVH